MVGVASENLRRGVVHLFSSWSIMSIIVLFFMAVLVLTFSIAAS